MEIFGWVFLIAWGAVFAIASFNQWLWETKPSEYGEYNY